MKHKTFAKENEKKLKLIIKALRDEVRRLEVDIKELKKELQNAGKPRKERPPKVPKEPKPPKTEKPKQVPKVKQQIPLTAEQRAAFCEDFSKRFKKSREESTDD